MTTIEDLLAFEQTAANDPTTLAAEELAAVMERFVVLAKVCPDDKEDLREDQESWLNEWRVNFVRLRF